MQIYSYFYQKIKVLWFPIFIFIICCIFILLSQSYGRDASLFPFTVGLITAFLLILEIVFRCLEKNTNLEHTSNRNNLKISSIIWFGFNLLIFLNLGIVFSIFISTFSYWYLLLKAKLYNSILFGILHSFLFWFSFEFLAGFRLYRGLLDF